MRYDHVRMRFVPRKHQDNCGTGTGGFQEGNTCAKGSGESSADTRGGKIALKDLQDKFPSMTVTKKRTTGPTYSMIRYRLEDEKFIASAERTTRNQEFFGEPSPLEKRQGRWAVGVSPWDNYAKRETSMNKHMKALDLEASQVIPKLKEFMGR